MTFRTGQSYPTCAGVGCGSSCKGYFCEGNPLTQNPDFLDPRNPDSVQNPIGPYYGDWDGTITRSTTAVPGPSTTSKQVPTITAVCQATTTLNDGSPLSYCDCGTGYASTLPLIPSTTAPCDYTALPRICHHGASPQQGLEYCNCDGYPHTLPTLAGEARTDAAGNVLACETSTVEAQATACAGASYTATRAPEPTATPHRRCITAHVVMGNCILNGDVVAVQAWEEGAQTCKGGKRVDFASFDTEFDIDCGGGVRVAVSGNAGKVVYHAADGWEAELAIEHGAFDTYQCGWMERANGAGYSITVALGIVGAAIKRLDDRYTKIADDKDQKIERSRIQPAAQAIEAEQKQPK
ncbi:hypothetical protein C8A01DRAFT_35295 [Parachaetomium inaequale]|uniref:Uncharacterized protein n=1 Tax=Parachaetomium inaequale TaxID=2588326 RepID=A0AAN6SS73_9PEZI|nr:hypothetical protein C8A01DRAFT_35295 [Parachaetomium inaequale]